MVQVFRVFQRRPILRRQDTMCMFLRNIRSPVEERGSLVREKGLNLIWDQAGTGCLILLSPFFWILDAVQLIFLSLYHSIHNLK
ncbi:hypothetical protein D3C81_1805850 [compost metagenome]